MPMSIRHILADHARRYPAWELDDLYKLIHQAAMGSEHAITDEAGIRDWLNRELRDLGPGPDEPMIDPISPDGRIVRVHLRPFVQRRLPAERLLRAFLATGRRVDPSPERLATFAVAASHAARQGLLPFRVEQLDARLAGLRASGLPPVHHSARYLEQYLPAYRVVARDLLEDDIFEAP
jgi:hypothetical protein